VARAFSTLIRFHAASGLRVGLRANAIVLGIVVFAFGSAPEPRVSLEHFIRGIGSTAAETGSRLTLAAIAAALAGIAAPRVTLGTAGWMRSLPSSARTTRVVIALTLVAAQVIVLLFLPIAGVVTVGVYHAPLSIGRMIAMVVLVLAIATAFVPSPWLSRALAAGAAAAAIVSTPTAVVTAVLLVAIAGSLPGDIVTQRHGFGSIAGRLRRRASRARGAAMWRRIVWRGMGLRRAAGCTIIPLLICAYAYFIVTNNLDLTTAESTSVVRWCGGIALALIAASLANVVLISRQPWPWVRSLPWSARQRVLVDAAILGAFGLIVPIVLLPLGLVPALTVAAIVPLASLLGASAIRAGRGRQSGAAGETLGLIGAAAVTVAIWPLTALIVLAAAPLAYRWAVARERRASVTRWLELHHDARSDPLWGVDA
jgi:hypothetical protein